jgi:hypothetical protein
VDRAGSELELRILIAVYRKRHIAAEGAHIRQLWAMFTRDKFFPYF